jgi:hypothetical protein
VGPIGISGNSGPGTELRYAGGSCVGRLGIYLRARGWAGIKDPNEDAGLLVDHSSESHKRGSRSVALVNPHAASPSATFVGDLSWH